MVQVKKPELRDAILKSAMRLFSRKGYTKTSLNEIARGAGISTANLYVYFRSKLEILYAMYDPWIRERLSTLEAKMSMAREPQQKLRLLLTALWRDLPAEKNGFVNNVMQAISSATPDDRYKPNTLNWTVEQLERMLSDALPPERRKALSKAKIAYLLVMAYDGFTIYRHVYPDAPLDDGTIEAVVSMLLGNSRKAAAK